jgi:DinB superfamily
VFAGALDWPGWCRSARDEAAARQALVDYGARYARALRGTRLGFARPKTVADLEVVQRLKGDATTDFGAPSIPPAADARPFTPEDLARQERILRACWRTLDRAAEAAEGVQLTKGPRGGGRELPAIVGHVVGAEASYARRILAKAPSVDGADAIAARDDVREAAVAALERAASGELPKRGPRGGKLWSPRYFVRRAAWHVLDHAWEIEDRS